MSQRYILGISAFYHDSAAVLIKNGEIIAAASEERFTRVKHDSGFPLKAIAFCLEEANTSLAEVESIIFYDKPFLKFERILETHYNFAPKSFLSFLLGVPTWIKEKLLLKKIIKDGLKKFPGFDKKMKILFSEHHLSHAASAFYPSPFKRAAILTIDGVGEWATATMGKGNGEKIELLKELHFPHSVGLLYSAFTYYLGFKVNDGEYKLMGLAPYGDANSEQTHRFIKLIKENFIDLKDDGSVALDQEFFNYCKGLSMVPDKKWHSLLGIEKREPEGELTKEHFNLALAAQIVTEEIILKMAQHLKNITEEENLVLAGGVALNCVANGKLSESKIFKNIWIQPAAGDAGGALGAALAANYIYHQREREVSIPDSMGGSLLGPAFDDAEIKAFLDEKKIPYERLEDEVLFEKVAESLASEKIVGWFQGRMEWGPRALGNRSILADPRPLDMQKRLNQKIKRRESFRPFAPSVLEEDASEYFDSSGVSPYMLLVSRVKKEGHSAITHVDGSARVQSVSKETNLRYWSLINSFKRQTGVAMLVNTSFNVRGEPIICSPADAYNCYMATEIDLLVLGNYLLVK